MQRKSKKQNENEIESITASPYRMGNWTVTMLKEELRERQLPISGKKAELIDRLESHSPIKLTAAPNTNPAKETISSPLKARLDIEKIAPSVLSHEQRGRGRSRSSSPSHRMLTRSRSTSLSQGTFLTWSRAPLSVITNFIFSLVEIVNSNSLLFASLTAIFIASVALLYFNREYRAVTFERFSGLQPFLHVYLDGFLSNLGFKRSGFRHYISRAARFMYDCSSGNIERNSVSGRLRCSATPLRLYDFGLPGRLFLLEKEQFLSWIFGSICASSLVYLIAEKGRTALPLQVNQISRKFMTFCKRFIYPITILVPFEAVGLISGLSGYTGNKFGTLMILKCFLAIPLQFGSRIFFSKYQKVFESQLARLPTVLVSASTLIFNFLDSSIYVISARQAFNAALYLFICATAIQVIANTRVYKRNLRD